MRLIAVLGAGLAVSSLALASSTGRIVSSHGVQLVAPRGWQRVQAADESPETDPRTLLMVGTAGVRPRVSHCQIAAYRLPRAGAVVVVVGWNRLALSGVQGRKPGRAPLGKLRRVHRPSFECFSGRGALATLVLGGKAYQGNVMVGDGASKQRVTEVLSIARSFDRAR